MRTRYSLIRQMPYDRATRPRSIPHYAANARRVRRSDERRFTPSRWLRRVRACPALVRRRPDNRRNEAALAAALEALRQKDRRCARVGGYHLLCDAADTNAVADCVRASGPAKPLAVMSRGAAATGWTSAQLGPPVAARAATLPALSVRSCSYRGERSDDLPWVAPVCGTRLDAALRRCIICCSRSWRPFGGTSANLSASRC